MAPNDIVPISSQLGRIDVHNNRLYSATKSSFKLSRPQPHGPYTSFPIVKISQFFSVGASLGSVVKTHNLL